VTSGPSVEVTDAYLEYVSRKRSAEEATRDLAARRKPRTGEAALIPLRDLRERIEDALAGMTVRNDGGYEIHGPVCSDDLHTFVVRLGRPTWYLPEEGPGERGCVNCFHHDRRCCFLRSARRMGSRAPVLAHRIALRRSF
jgi:hypothetical protein